MVAVSSRSAPRHCRSISASSCGPVQRCTIRSESLCQQFHRAVPPGVQVAQGRGRRDLANLPLNIGVAVHWANQYFGRQLSDVNRQRRRPRCGCAGVELHVTVWWAPMDSNHRLPLGARFTASPLHPSRADALVRFGFRHLVPSVAVAVPTGTTQLGYFDTLRHRPGFEPGSSVRHVRPVRLDYLVAAVGFGLGWRICRLSLTRVRYGQRLVYGSASALGYVLLQAAPDFPDSHGRSLSCVFAADSGSTVRAWAAWLLGTGSTVS